MKNFKKVFLIIALSITLTGCTQYVKDGKKTVINNETGQTLTSNILCKPTEKNLIDLYTKNNVDVEKLPSCEKYKYNDTKYNGLWEALFVKPLALVIIWTGKLIGNYGIAVMLIGLLIRLIIAPLTKKSMAQSEKMKEAQKDLNRLETKYQNRTDKESMMAKSQEQLMIYQKYGINPISGCLVSFIQLPLFFAFLEAINRVPAIFEEKLLGLHLGTTPWVGISKGNYLYIILIVLIIASTYFSFRNSMSSVSGGGTEQEKQTRFMMMFMLVFISIASFSLPTAIALYWIVTNLFAVVQTEIVKRKMQK